MKRILLLAAFAAIFLSCGQEKVIVEVDTPQRPAGQEDVIGLTAPAIDTVKVGIIGLGMRGELAVERFTHVPGARITAVCDVYEDRVDKAQKILADAGMPSAAGYSGDREVWKKVCERDDVDLVYVITDWESHAKMGVYAMEHGKHVAIEVPGAITIDEIWQLINTSERTRKHCMQLENCIYDFFELTALNMAQQGLFGEVLHMEGAYIHNLEEVWPKHAGNWQLLHNKDHKGVLYPTHGFGPICQVLDIHRGDRLKTLVAVDTKAVNGPKMMEMMTGEKCESFRNGDQTMAMLTTENGKTVLLEYNVMTPRPYDRMYQVVGTEGYANKYPVEQYMFQNIDPHDPVSAEMKVELDNKYKHRILVELEEDARRVGGHGGMDYILDYRLIYCLRHGLPLDMDVYDLAEWCSVIELSRMSIENGNRPVAVPDFTRGAWNQVKGYRHAFAE